MKCPVCGSEINIICDKCGYDSSADFILHKTIFEVSPTDKLIYESNLASFKEKNSENKVNPEIKNEGAIKDILIENIVADGKKYKDIILKKVEKTLIKNDKEEKEQIPVKNDEEEKEQPSVRNNEGEKEQTPVKNDEEEKEQPAVKNDEEEKETIAENAEAVKEKETEQPIVRGENNKTEILAEKAEAVIEPVREIKEKWYVSLILSKAVFWFMIGFGILGVMGIFPVIMLVVYLYWVFKIKKKKLYEFIPFVKKRK